MDINQFIANFAAQFDDTDTSDFNEDTKFREIDEWSSLTALSVIAMTDEEYDVKLRGEDIRTSQSILDLYAIIKSRK